MRLADQMECIAGGRTPEATLADSRDRSDFAFADTVGGEVLAEWGWRDRGDGGADVWMLTFDAIEAHKVYAARRSRAAINLLLEEFDFLHVEVHVQHTLAVKWLRWLGFRTVHMKISPVGGTFNVMERRKWGV